MLYALPFIRKKTFWNQKFSQGSRIPLQNFSAQWDEKLSAENCDTPIMPKILRLPQAFWNLEGKPTLFSALLDLTFSTEKRLYP